MIEYTNHALRKIKQRHLRKEWIQRTLENPEFKRKGYSNREIAYKKIGKLYLSVVFMKENKNTVVLTAHWDKSFKPEKVKIKVEN